MAGWNEDDAKKAIAELIKRGTTDSAFRSLALSDPMAAIREINPEAFPPGFKVQVVAADGHTLTAVLPDLVQKGGELSDAELEQVAGGAQPYNPLDPTMPQGGGSVTNLNPFQYP